MVVGVIMVVMFEDDSLIRTFLFQIPAVSVMVMRLEDFWVRTVVTDLHRTVQYRIVENSN